MKQVELIFCSPESQDQDYRLKWQVQPNFSADVWFQKLTELSRLGRPIFYPRFTGFISRFKTMAHIRDQLNQVIEIINSQNFYHIKERATEKFDQEFSNVIHHHFEILVASAEKPTEYFKKFSERAKTAALLLNHCIHDMEALHRSELQAKAKRTSGAALTLEARNIPRFRVPNEFNKDFSLNNDFGDMVLHYSQIGKTWWEVFLDKDEEIFPEAILPLYAVSGEFDVFFEGFTISEKQKSDFYSFLRKYGKDPNDPSLRLGYVCVAKLIREDGKTNGDYYQNIANHLALKEVVLSNDGQVIGTLLPDYKTFLI